MISRFFFIVLRITAMSLILKNRSTLHAKPAVPKPIANTIDYFSAS